MKMNHANLVTDDVAGLSDFLVSHFGFKLVAMRGKEAFAVLAGADGFSLNLMKPGKGQTASYPDGFHVGFFVGKPSMVFQKQAELADAHRAPGEVQEMMRGGVNSTTFYCHAPGGILIEVSSSQT